MSSAVVSPYKQLKQQLPFLSDQEYSEEHQKICNDVIDIFFMSDPAGKKKPLLFFVSLVLRCSSVPLQCGSCSVKSHITVALPHQRENPVSENGYKPLEIWGWKTPLVND